MKAERVKASTSVLGRLLEVFPELTRNNVSRFVLLPAFATGALGRYGLKLLGQRIDARTAQQADRRSVINYAFIITIFVDAAFDGLTIGSGFAAGHLIGFALAVGLSIEMLFLCLSLTSDTIHGPRMLAIAAGVATTLLVTMIAGYYLLRNASTTLISVALTLSAAALIYLVAEELLEEAHETQEARYAMLILFRLHRLLGNSRPLTASR